jgi:hypothetical protein
MLAPYSAEPPLPCQASGCGHAAWGSCQTLGSVAVPEEVSLASESVRPLGNQERLLRHAVHALATWMLSNHSRSFVQDRGQCGSSGTNHRSQNRSHCPNGSFACGPSLAAALRRPQSDILGNTADRHRAENVNRTRITRLAAAVQCPQD